MTVTADRQGSGIREPAETSRACGETLRDRGKEHIALLRERRDESNRKRTGQHRHRPAHVYFDKPHSRCDQYQPESTASPRQNVSNASKEDPKHRLSDTPSYHLKQLRSPQKQNGFPDLDKQGSPEQGRGEDTGKESKQHDRNRQGKERTLYHGANTAQQKMSCARFTPEDHGRTHDPLPKRKRAPQVASRSLLSFGDDMDIEEPEGSVFSLADRTQRKFTEERRIGGCNPMFDRPSALFMASPTSISGTDDVCTSIHRKSLGHLCFGAASTRGARAYMEDRHTVIASYSPSADGISRSFAAVYDGHNGARAAEHCSSRLHVVLASNPAMGTCTGSSAADKAEQQRMGAAFCSTFHALDKEILHKSRHSKGRDGCTGLVLLRVGEVVYTAHCGDSRAVLSRAGKAVRITQDHKPDTPGEASRIRQAGGRTHFTNCWRVIIEPKDGQLGSGLAVSRSFGDLDFKEPLRLVECEPEVGCWPLLETDCFIILASDGLWDVMSDLQAVDCVQKVLKTSFTAKSGRQYSDQDAKRAADSLVSSAVKQGTLDNVTAVVCLLPWD